MTALSIRELASRHWFYLLLPVWLAASWSLRGSSMWNQQPRLGEAIVLFDWCIFMPVLFAICYRDMPHRALALRMLALFCGGIWLAGQIVPPEAQDLLGFGAGLRWVGLIVLVLFEAAAIMAMLRIVFGEAPSAAALERQGIPPVIARLMVLEARFWRWVWKRLTGK